MILNKSNKFTPRYFRLGNFTRYETMSQHSGSVLFIEKRFHTSTLRNYPFVEESERKGRDVPKIAEQMDQVSACKTRVQEGINRIESPNPLSEAEKKTIAELAQSEDFEGIKDKDDVSLETLTKFKASLDEDLDKLANTSAEDFLPPLAINKGSSDRGDDENGGEGDNGGQDENGGDDGGDDWGDSFGD